MRCGTAIPRHPLTGNTPCRPRSSQQRRIPQTRRPINIASCIALLFPLANGYYPAQTSATSTLGFPRLQLGWAFLATPYSASCDSFHEARHTTALRLYGRWIHSPHCKPNPWAPLTQIWVNRGRFRSPSFSPSIISTSMLTLVLAHVYPVRDHRSHSPQ